MPIANIIRSISAHAFMDEKAAIGAMLNYTTPLAPLVPETLQRARAYVEAIRGAERRHGMEAFLHTYGLNTEEGVALMCLAEALLRIPDAKTADQLIEDTFKGRDWRAQAAGADSWLISASSWGLLLADKVVNFGDKPEHGISGTLRGMIGRVSEPVLREALKAAMRLIGSQFVLGETIEDGLANAKPWAKKGFRFSFDILGEGARSDAQAARYLQAYRQAIALVGAGARDIPLFAAPGISVKLSALHPRYSLSQRGRVLSELKPRLKDILLLAKQYHITVSIDAEEANRLDMEMLLFAELCADTDLAGWNGMGFVVQAYQKRAFYVIDFLHELAKQHRRIIPVRLVKGAYWDSEIKHAQVMGLPGYPVFTRKECTDLSYLACAKKILKHTDCFYPQFATHNAHTIASIETMAKKFSLASDRFEFQRLHGMGEALHDMVIERYASRIYAPIGAHEDLLAYLIRRLLENGANTSFVNLLMDKEVNLEALLKDPIVASQTILHHVSPAIPNPRHIYPDRKNSSGLDLGYLTLREPLEKALATHCDIVARMLAPAGTDAKALDALIARAKTAFAGWAARQPDERCRIIEKTADLMEAHRDELIALLVHEAGKTVPDAIAEVREAADFCRYYAMLARKLTSQATPLTSPTGESNALSLVGRGVFACISPWNFPLAIFTGQIVAALVTGNVVIAKPAEQTPRIAQKAVALMHEAGIPEMVVSLAIGKGNVTGAALVSDERVDGVVFTGSVEVAQHINRSLANRKGAIVPFIAETGGMNCMVIDSSALLEQAVDDVILSAFGSAGQRCSALRVLYVQEDIADTFITLLKGAMQELNVGTPSQIAVDVGSVIDAEAQEKLHAHIARMKQEAILLAAATPSDDAGHFVTPHAFEIKHISQLENEVFGPILHIIRFPYEAMQQVADDINATGYGLTFGMHSRVEEHIAFFTRRVHAGNLYINRSMIGAVVGVQPFGGEGLSGTGPKAGGPYYLLKFLHERTLTVNTAAIGGNLALLTGQ